MNDIEMEVDSVRIDTNNLPLVLLRERNGDRVLPVWIGPAEAVSINQALEGEEPPRPMTHDLIRQILGDLQARVERVVIRAVEGDTFFASLFIAVPDGQRREIDCRPSDGIAVALRTEAPIYIHADLLDRIAKERAEMEARQREGRVVLDPGNSTIH